MQLIMGVPPRQSLITLEFKSNKLTISKQDGSPPIQKFLGGTSVSSEIFSLNELSRTDMDFLAAILNESRAYYRKLSHGYPSQLLLLPLTEGCSD
jgi:hypothetical protein